MKISWSGIHLGNVNDKLSFEVVTLCEIGGEIMESDEGLATERLELISECCIQPLQLLAISSRPLGIAVSAIWIGFNQTVTDVFHLLDGAEGVQPDVGLTSP